MKHGSFFFLPFTAAFYVCGLNLTENAAYVLLHPLQSMKTMTRRALSLLLNWASKQRPGSQVGGLNVLCCDFVDGSQFCSLVIGLNYKLLDPAEADVRGKNRWVHFFPHLCSFTFSQVMFRFLALDDVISHNELSGEQRGNCSGPYPARKPWKCLLAGVCYSCHCVMTEASSAFSIFLCITHKCLEIWHFHDLIVYFPRN